MIPFLEKLHDTIDEIFETKKRSEQIIFYAVPFLILGFLSYQFITPISERKIAEKKQKRAELKKEISDTKEYLSKKDNILSEMKIIAQTNNALKLRLQQQISENSALSGKISTLDFIYLNDKNVIDFLDNLTTASAKNRVTVLELTTSMQNKEKDLFKKQMRVDLNCSGDFAGLLAFANEMESSKMYTRIEKLDMSYGKRINAQMQINVSGL